jgi:hypothetical protein
MYNINMNNYILFALAFLVVFFSLTSPDSVTKLSNTTMGKLVMILLIVIFVAKRTLCGVLFGILIVYIYIDLNYKLEEVENTVVRENMTNYILYRDNIKQNMSTSFNPSKTNNKVLAEQMTREKTEGRFPRSELKQKLIKL